MVSVGSLPPVRYATVDDEVVANRDLGGPGVALVYLGTKGHDPGATGKLSGWAILVSNQ